MIIWKSETSGTFRILPTHEIFHFKSLTPPYCIISVKRILKSCKKSYARTRNSPSLPPSLLPPSFLSLALPSLSFFFFLSLPFSPVSPFPLSFSPSSFLFLSPSLPFCLSFVSLFPLSFSLSHISLAHTCTRGVSFWGRIRRLFLPLQPLRAQVYSQPCCAGEPEFFPSCIQHWWLFLPIPLFPEPKRRGSWLALSCL